MGQRSRFALASLIGLTFISVLIGIHSQPTGSHPEDFAGVERDQLKSNLASSTGSCGVERWSVKTGTDADANLVNLGATTPTSIVTMSSYPQPATLPANNRIQPQETTVYSIDANLTEYKLETDSDYHLVIQDGAGNTMITEIPDPACAAGSLFLSSIQSARNEFDSKFLATGSFKTANVPVRVRGIGFFDYLHGQTGVAPNGIELHPVLDVQFNPSAALPGVSSVIPNTGPSSGGTSVTITGTNYTGATTVKFGGTATTFTVVGPTQINATSPSGFGVVDVTVTNAGGTSPVSSADEFTYPPASPGVYTAMTPVRVLDTRLSGGPLGPGASVNLVVGGTGSVPVNATAAILNVTAVDSSTAGFFTVFPTGAPLPTASNLNWLAGETVPNLVSVELGTGGSVTIYNGLGTADAVVDLQGYFTPSSGGTGGQFVPLVPARITDTRAASGQPNAGLILGSGITLDVQISGAGGVPATGVTAVVLNVTVTDTTSAGFLTVFPKGATRPLASNLNWAAEVTVPNRVMVPVGTGGMVSFFNGLGSADLVVDVNGYFTDSTTAGASFMPLVPYRIVDTRNGTGAPIAPLTGGTPLVVTVAGSGNVPAMTSTTPPQSVVLNVTVANPTAASDLVVWPDGVTKPVASDLNFVPAQTVPNLVVVKLSSTGQIDIFNPFGTTNVIVDVVGWYG